MLLGLPRGVRVGVDNAARGQWMEEGGGRMGDVGQAETLNCCQHAVSHCLLWPADDSALVCSC